MNRSNISQRILQCAIEAGGAGSENDSNDVSSSSDREWLHSALNGIISAPTLVDKLKVYLQILEATWNDPSVDVTEIEDVFEEMSAVCEDIDLACDLHKLGGFPIVIKYLNHHEPNIQYKAEELIAVVAQNNDYGQNKLLELKILPKLLKKMDVSENYNEQTGQVAIKAVYAVSCLVRQNESALEEFLAADGVSFLLRGMQSVLNKLQLKCVFLLRSICQESSKTCNVVHDMGFVTQLASILQSTNQADVMEFILEIFLYVAMNHEGFKASCEDPRLNLREILSNVSSSNISKEREEIKEHCASLLKLLRSTGEEIER